MTFLGWLSDPDPFERLSDLQLGDEKVTKNHLVKVMKYDKLKYDSTEFRSFLEKR